MAICPLLLAQYRVWLHPASGYVSLRAPRAPRALRALRAWLVSGWRPVGVRLVSGWCPVGFRLVVRLASGWLSGWRPVNVRLVSGWRPVGCPDGVRLAVRLESGSCPVGVRLVPGLQVSPVCLVGVCLATFQNHRFPKGSLATFLKPLVPERMFWEPSKTIGSRRGL